MNKVIYFDMDGTIANLYAVEGWLDMLRNFEPYPYLEAAPMCDMFKLVKVLNALKAEGYIIGVITWLSKESTKEYDKEVRATKRLWLEAHGLWACMDEVHMVKYGTPKHRVAKIRQGILIDDNSDVRKAWENHGGETINPIEEDLIEALARLVEGEM